MKTVSVAMDAHLKQGATTLTTCWKITRTDGREFFYTELDRDIPFEGEVYKSAAGFNKSAITSSATFAVDKMEVTGFLRDDGITDDEIRNGAFDHAKVEVFMVNYEDASMGKIRLRAGPPDDSGTRPRRTRRGRTCRAACAPARPGSGRPCRARRATVRRDDRRRSAVRSTGR